MGQMEERSKKRTRNQELKAIILGSVAIAGGLAVALIAPNVLGAMGKLGLVPKGRQGEYIAAARKRLKKAGLLAEEGGYLRITDKGSRELISLSLKQSRPSVMKRWDEKWRILIFDIPERRRSSRDKIRTTLHSGGFVRIQDSVWLYPYPCEEFVALLKADAKIGKDMLYLIVESLEGDRTWRQYFNLPLSKFVPPPPLKLPGVLDAALDVILPKPGNSSRS